MPWGIRKGLKPTKKKMIKNVLLEEIYMKSGERLNHNQLVSLAKQLDWSVRKVEQWSEFS